jgi:hypothetical protein
VRACDRDLIAAGWAAYAGLEEGRCTDGFLGRSDIPRSNGKVPGRARAADKPGAWAPWRVARGVCLPFVMLAALAACDIGEAPTDPAVPGEPAATEATGSEPDAIRNERPPDDPRAWVFEELNSPSAVLNELEVGECVLHYRRWNGKYTPVPYQLRYSGGDPDDPGFPAVMNLRRGDNLDVRASCLLPRDAEAGTEAMRDLEQRIREPGFVRGPEGNLQIPATEPDRSAWAPLDSGA